MSPFQPCATLAENIQALLEALGSVARPLSQADLADLIRADHPDSRSVNASTVGRWIKGRGEPDRWSLAIMARLAGVTMEEFAAVGGGVNQADEGAEASGEIPAPPAPSNGDAPDVKHTRPPWPDATFPDPLSLTTKGKRRKA